MNGRFEFYVDKTTRKGVVRLDGADISDSVVAVTMESMAREGTIVTLTLFIPEPVIEAEGSTVELRPDTADLLTRLGWTPPVR